MENRLQDYLHFGFSILISFLLLLPLLWYGFAEEQGLYSYGAWVWRNLGHAPYSYCFDRSFPGIFFIHYFVQSTLGESVTAFRIFDLIWQTGAAILVYMISVRIFKNAVSGLLAAAFYSISYVDLGAWNTGQRDGFLLLLYLLSFWIYIDRKSHGRALIRALVSGLLIGFALIIKPVAAIVALIFLVMIFKTEKHKFLSCLAFIAACAFPLLAVIAYYWRLGALQDIYQALILFNSKLYFSALAFDLKRIINGIVLKNYLLANSIILLGAALLPVQRKKVPNQDRTYLSWLLVIFLGVYFGYLAQAKYYFYQQAPVWGLLCMFAGGGWGLGIDFINSKWPSKTRTRTFVLTTALILTTILLIKPYVHEYLVKALRVSPREGQRIYPFYDVCFQAASHIEQNSGPGDKVQVWGGEAIINYLARRQAPSRFPSTLYFTLPPGPDSRASLQRNFGKELLGAITKEPPLYFIVELPHPVSGITCDKEILTRDYPEIWAFITTKYSFDIKIGFMEIYRRNP